MDGNLCGIVLAGVYHTLTFYYVSKYRQNINNTEYAKESLFKFNISRRKITRFYKVDILPMKYYLEDFYKYL